MIRFAIKASLAGGAVYYVADQGVWQDSKETSKLYDRITDAMKPYVNDVKAQLPIEIPELPSTNRVSYVTKQYWNQGVFATFTFLGDLPSHVTDWTKRGITAVRSNEEINKFIDSFSSTPSPVEEPSKATE